MLKKILLMIALVSLVACGSGGFLTSNQSGEGAWDAQTKTSDSGENEGIQEDIAVIDRGVIAGDDIVDESFAVSDSNNDDAAAVTAQAIAKKVEQYQIEQNDGEPLVFTVYFDFDSSEIDEGTLDIIAKHADFLNKNRDVRLRLLGHTDARGSREYNLALGENRGLSVKSIFALYNLSDIEVISFGEEKPVKAGDNEAAWQKNRRVELVYY